MDALYFQCVSPRHRFEKKRSIYLRVAPRPSSSHMLGMWVVSRIWLTERHVSCLSRSGFPAALSCSMWPSPQMPAGRVTRKIDAPVHPGARRSTRHVGRPPRPRKTRGLPQRFTFCPANQGRARCLSRRWSRPTRVEAAGPIDTICCHLDFDGLCSAAKWIRGGLEPYPEGADRRCSGDRYATRRAE